MFQKCGSHKLSQKLGSWSTLFFTNSTFGQNVSHKILLEFQSTSQMRFPQRLTARFGHSFPNNFEGSAHLNPMAPKFCSRPVQNLIISCPPITDHLIPVRTINHHAQLVRGLAHGITIGRKWQEQRVWCKSGQTRETPAQLSSGQHPNFWLAAALGQCPQVQQQDQQMAAPLEGERKT